MRFFDIIRQSGKSLWRHKGRTLLTILGVLVGCCSVVLMLSIGIGMKESSDATLAQMGDLRKITVTTSGQQGELALNQDAVSLLRGIEHAETIIPKLRYDGDAVLTAGPGGRYQTPYAYIVGADLSLAQQEGMELTSGDWGSVKTSSALAGEYLDYAFQDTKRPEGHNQINRYDYYDWETDSLTDIPDSYIHVSSEPVTLTLRGEDEASSVHRELQVGGIVQENWSLGSETSDGLIMDLQTLQAMIQEYQKKQKEKTGKENLLNYSEIIVLADDISNVETVEKEIKKLGFQTSSMESIRKPMEQDTQQKQMLLGCVGIVSLFVAALGIANTMIMAITERTREIGIMKALGCKIKNIRAMFLWEAAFIGLFGGIIGILLSYLVSWIMNHADLGGLFAGEYSYMASDAPMSVSVIPWWLSLFAIVFSVFIGICSGIYPAEKAVRIPALKAMQVE